MQKMDNSLLEKEAELFSKYLLNQFPNQTVKVLYVKAMQLSDSSTGIQDKKLVQFVTENNWSIGLIDSGLAIIRPDAEVRRRLYILFALLESMPDYWDHFLPKKRSPFYLIVIVFHGTAAILKATLGIALIKLLEIFPFKI